MSKGVPSMIGLRLWLAWLLVVGTAVLNAPAWAASDFVVTLLGTASPTPRPGRMGPSTLVVVNGQRLLLDAGRGATVRLWQMPVPIGSLDATFLTHSWPSTRTSSCKTYGGPLVVGTDLMSF